MDIVNDLDKLQEELVRFYEMFDESPQMIAYKVKELVATKWKDEKLKKEIEEECKNQEYCIEMIHALKQIIEFVKLDNPSDEEFKQFVSKMMEKNPNEMNSEKSMKEHKEKMFLDMDGYSSFEN